MKFKPKDRKTCVERELAAGFSDGISRRRMLKEGNSLLPISVVIAVKAIKSPGVHHHLKSPIFGNFEGGIR